MKLNLNQNLWDITGKLRLVQAVKTEEKDDKGNNVIQHVDITVSGLVINALLAELPADNETVPDRNPSQPSAFKGALYALAKRVYEAQEANQEVDLAIEEVVLIKNRCAQYTPLIVGQLNAILG